MQAAMGFHRAAPAAGKRHFNRLRLGVPAALVLPHGTVDCLIDDISCTGARLRIDRTLASDQAVVLSFPNCDRLPSCAGCAGANAG